VVVQLGGSWHQSSCAVNFDLVCFDLDSLEPIFNSSYFILIPKNMLILYGLGNDELKYLRTKHNCGRIIVEKIASSQKTQFQDTSFGCRVAKVLIDSVEIWLVYSKGYMNLSGDPISSLIRYHKLSKSKYKLIVLQDDSVGGRSAGHKGIDSIYNHRSTIDAADLWKLKIGIRPELNKSRSETFVLSGCKDAELNWYDSLAQKITDNINLFESQDIAKLQNIFNSKMSQN
jgi:peptidyl-tRNA hydrolase, PTH1 family